MLKAKINVKIVNCNIEMQKIQEELQPSSPSLIGFDVGDEEYYYDEDDDDFDDEDIEQITKMPIGFGG